MNIVTCDVGNEGAIVIGKFEDNRIEIISFSSMPKDVKCKMKILREWKEKYSIDLIIIEEQGGRGGNSANSNFTIGVNLGIIKCIVELLELETIFVNPKTWQTILKDVKALSFEGDKSNEKLKSSKKKSITLAKSSFPNLSLAKKTSRSVKYLDGVTDALCILLWYLSKFHKYKL